tara:strand:+ start:2304 stop:2855 length:552 start_codon:yes stop_codon:yes gene_type:complete
MSRDSKSGPSRGSDKEEKNEKEGGGAIQLSKRLTFLIVSVIMALLAAVLGLGYLLIKKSAVATSGHKTSNTFDVKKKDMVLTSTSEVEGVVAKATESAPTLLMVGHPGCGHCIDTVPAFVEAAGDKAGKSVFIVDANQCDSSILSKFDISVYPMILKYTSPTSRVEHDDDARTAASLRAFFGS